MLAVYRAMLRTAVAVDRAPELAPIIRSAVAPLLSAPLTPAEKLSSAAHVVRTRFRDVKKAALPTDPLVGSASLSLQADENLFRLLKVLRAALAQHRDGSCCPALYSAALGSSAERSLLLVIGETALVIGGKASELPHRQRSAKKNGEQKPPTLLQLCKQRHFLDLSASASTTNWSRRLRHLSRELPVLTGGNVAAPAPILVHSNPLVAHMVQEMIATTPSLDRSATEPQQQSSSSFSEEDPVFLNDLRHVLRLPSHVVATLNKSNCRVFSSHLSQEQLRNVTSRSSPLELLDSTDAINRCLFGTR